MGTKEKLIERFKRQPVDFTWEELVRLLSFFGYVQDNKGKTSGSRVAFENINGYDSFTTHKPHPGNIVKGYVMKELLNILKENGLI